MYNITDNDAVMCRRLRNICVLIWLSQTVAIGDGFVRGIHQFSGPRFGEVRHWSHELTGLGIHFFVVAFFLLLVLDAGVHREIRIFSAILMASSCVAIGIHVAVSQRAGQPQWYYVPIVSAWLTSLLAFLVTGLVGVALLLKTSVRRSLNEPTSLCGLSQLLCFVSAVPYLDASEQGLSPVDIMNGFFTLAPAPFSLYARETPGLMLGWPILDSWKLWPVQATILIVGTCTSYLLCSMAIARLAIRRKIRSG
jgi:hypothetical protein